MVYSDARYCAGRSHRDNPRHGRLPRNRAAADAEIRSTGVRIARYSQMADPPCRPQRHCWGDIMLQSSSAEMAPRYRRIALGIVLSALLASCDDGYGGGG